MYTHTLDVCPTYAYVQYIDTLDVYLICTYRLGVSSAYTSMQSIDTLDVHLICTYTLDVCPAHTCIQFHMYLRLICDPYVLTYNQLIHTWCVSHMCLHTINWYTLDVYPIWTYIQTMHALDVAEIYVLIHKQYIHLMWVSYVLMYRQGICTYIQSIDTHLMCITYVLTYNPIFTYIQSPMYLRTIHWHTWCVSHMYLHTINGYTWCASHTYQSSSVFYALLFRMYFCKHTYTSYRTWFNLPMHGLSHGAYGCDRIVQGRALMSRRAFRRSRGTNEMLWL
jgi:hypothetical protein